MSDQIPPHLRVWTPEKTKALREHNRWHRTGQAMSRESIGWMIRNEYFSSASECPPSDAPLPHVQPPRLAERIGALFLKPEFREAVLGDRAEEYGRNVARFGEPRAKLLYLWDALASLRALLRTRLKRGTALSLVASLLRRVVGG